MIDSCIFAHKNILKAFSERDAEAARKAVEEHLFQVGRLMRRHMGRIFVV
jgi:DNA-binding FadR family transcriptional regulator